jgi:hypothetical protein
MATIQAYGLVGAPPNIANLCTAQTGNGPSTNVADLGDRALMPAVLHIVTTVGATPTCTYLVEGSADGAVWFAAAIADPSAPETPTVATFAITTATTTVKLVRPNHPYRYLRLTLSANTNVTNSIDLWVF